MFQDGTETNLQDKHKSSERKERVAGFICAFLIEWILILPFPLELLYLSKELIFIEKFSTKEVLILHTHVASYT